MAEELNRTEAGLREAADTESEAASIAPHTSRRLADVFDNEALWDADDTDEYILSLGKELETALAVPLIVMKDAGGNSLLHMAAIWKRPKVMEALIRLGIELNDRNTNGQTPLDLATHYGNVDLALQLRHYGGKHTCESERDFAIAQRDLAQQQWHDVERDLNDVLARLKTTKQEREEIRIERDRLAAANPSLQNQRDTLAEEKTQLELVATALTHEKQQLLLQLAQVREALQCECNARQNAVQSWHNAQQIITELQERELAYREREEEAIRMRLEALNDRDVAREAATMAQLDQGLAKQAQLEAERERDAAVKKLLDAETFLESEKQLWAKRIAKTERDRKNIQIEIDRQTAALRKECDRLEKELRTSTTLTWTLREDVTTKDADLEKLRVRGQYLADQIDRLEMTKRELLARVDVLEEAEQTNHIEWKASHERMMKDAAAHDMRTIVADVLAMIERLQTTHREVQSLDHGVRREILVEPELATSFFAENNPPLASLSPMKSRKQPAVLPFLMDRSSSGQSVSSPADPVMPTMPAATSPPETSTNDHGKSGLLIRMLILE